MFSAQILSVYCKILLGWFYSACGCVILEFRKKEALKLLSTGGMPFLFGFFKPLTDLGP